MLYGYTTMHGQLNIKTGVPFAPGADVSFFHESTQSGSGDHDLVIIGHPVFVYRREGALAWCWALIPIQLRGHESMELYLHSLILFHDILLSWASRGPLLVFHWLQTIVYVTHIYVLLSSHSEQSISFTVQQILDKYLKTVENDLLNSTGFIFPVVWWQPSLCYRCVANRWLLQTVQVEEIFEWHILHVFVF